jgi:Undecaprenyl-phosphate galactose phosphotransferase WbaP
LRVFALLLCDLFAVSVAYTVGYVLWAGPILHLDYRSYSHVGFLLPVFLLAYGIAGMYPGFGLGAVETVRRLSYTTCGVFLLFTAIDFALKTEGRMSRMSFAIAWTGAMVLVPLVRFVMLSLAHGLRWWGEATVVVGTPRQIGLTVRSLRDAFSLGYTVVGALSLRGGSSREIEGVPLLGGLRSAVRLRELGVKTALVWDSRTQGKTLSYLSRVFPHVVIIRDGERLALERVRVRNLGGVLGIELTNELLRSRNRFLKRLIDLIVSVPMAIVGCPLVLVGGVAIKLTSSGPMFFRHKRVGLGGRTFQVLKLRTMHVDAEKRLAACLEQNPTARAEWERSVKLRNDPRIIPIVGHLLRRFSIDELPQLLAVIRGTMSLVGPRPFPPYHMEVFPAEFATLRCSVRPGLTGMWQVMTRSDGNLQDQMRYDSYYIRNWSLWFDGYLLARTVFAVISGGGSR